MTTAHTLNITQDGILKILKPILSMPGWTDNVGDMFAAGQILSMEAMTTDFKPTPGTDPVVILHLSEKQRDACKVCMRFFVEKKSIPGGAHTNQILIGLGLIDSSTL